MEKKKEPKRIEDMREERDRSDQVIERTRQENHTQITSM